jgi:anti-sigma factor RsiW
MMADERIDTHAEDLACIDLVELVTNYLEGALPDEEARRLELHLASCPGCTEYVAQLRTIAGSLRGLTEESFPPEIRDSVIADFRRLREG